MGKKLGRQNIQSYQITNSQTRGTGHLPFWGTVIAQTQKVNDAGVQELTRKSSGSWVFAKRGFGGGCQMTVSPSPCYGEDGRCTTTLPSGAVGLARETAEGAAGLMANKKNQPLGSEEGACIPSSSDPLRRSLPGPEPNRDPTELTWPSDLENLKTIKTSDPSGYSHSQG